MTPRVAILGIFHETNAFSPIRTHWDMFDRHYKAAELVHAFDGTRTVVGGFIAGASLFDLEVVPVFGAYATPSGTVTERALVELHTALQKQFDAAGEVDGVLLELHGAMVGEGTPDAEADILAAVRRRWPQSPVACVLDLHANMGIRRFDTAELLTGYRTNPHVDTYDRGLAAARHLSPLLEGATPPYRAHRGVPLIAPPVSQGTDASPMRELVALARDLETELGLVDVTVHGGYAYADVPHIGMGFSVTARPEHAADAEAAVDQLARTAWRRRGQFSRPLLAASAAFRKAASGPGCVAVTDTGDNINGGSPGDGTWLLHEALRSNVKTLASICDPSALAEITAAGVGAHLSVELGGHLTASSGPPLEIEVEVLSIADGTFTNTGPMATGATVSMGTTAVVRCATMDMVVQQRAVQPNDPELFRSLGLTPEDYDVVLLKGATAVRAAWAMVATDVVDAATPGVTDSDLARLHFESSPPHLFRASWKSQDIR